MTLFMRKLCIINLIERNFRSFGIFQALCLPRRIKVGNDYIEKTNDVAEINTLDSNSSDPIVQKYSKILANMRRSQFNEDVDCYYKTPFGHIRLDKDNIPDETNKINSLENELVNSLQIENSADFMKYSKGRDNKNYFDNNSKVSNITDYEKDKADSFIDDIYFGDSLNRKVNSYVVDENIKASSLKEDLNKEDLNYFDEMLFKHPPITKDYSSTSVSKKDLDNDKDLNVVDEFYFKSQSESKNIEASKEEVKEKSEYKSDFEKAISDDKSDDSNEFHHFSPQFSLGPHTRKLEENFKKSYEERLNALGSPKVVSKKGIKMVVQPSEDMTVDVTAENKDIYKEKDFDENSAFAYALKLRKDEKIKELSNGETKDAKEIPKYKSIVSMLPRYDKLMKYELDILLKNSIVYNEGDIVALNKPYGMRIHDGQESRENVLTLTELLPKLCKIVDTKKLHMIHRLDVNTTGILLLAKSEAMASELREMFKNNTVIKTYLAIVKGIPHIKQGLIDIPMKESITDGKRRMNLYPIMENNQSGQRKKYGIKATTKYKVLSESYSSSLLSVNPLTGVKHQIRAHLGLGLRCPVLADHKYSSLDKIVPQKLPSDVLERLQMKQSRVRDLPIMLHSSSIFLPQFLNGRNLKISCIPSSHFRMAMRTLKLTSKFNVLDMKNIEIIDLGAEIF